MSCSTPQAQKTRLHNERTTQLQGEYAQSAQRAYCRDMVSKGARPIFTMMPPQNAEVMILNSMALPFETSPDPNASSRISKHNVLNAVLAMPFLNPMSASFLLGPSYLQTGPMYRTQPHFWKGCSKTCSSPGLFPKCQLCSYVLGVFARAPHLRNFSMALECGEIVPGNSRCFCRHPMLDE